MKRRKVKSWKHDSVPEHRMLMRMVDVQADTADEDTKTVKVVIATENPVERFDYERGEVIREILDMAGVEFRTSRKQLPIVDSHDRSTVRNVLGSVRNIKIEDGQLTGEATFARDTDSQVAFGKLLDGHLTDFSITATPMDSEIVERGETIVFRNEEIEGPAEIVRQWTPTDASLVATGADELSTVRSLARSYEIKPPRNKMKKNVRRMDEEQNEEVRQILSRLVDGGMTVRDIATRMEMEEEEIQNIADGEVDGGELLEALQDLETKAMEIAEDVAEVVEPVDEVENKRMGDEEESEDEITNAVDRALKADRKRRREIRALCSKANIERAFADELCENGINLDAAREKVLQRMINQPLGTSSGERIAVTASSDDKFNNAVRDGLIARALRTVSRTDPFAGSKPAEGYEDFSQMGLFRIAEEILRRGQINTQRMTPKDIAMTAMGHRPTIDRLRYQGIMRSEPAYHTTGTLSNLTLDAANKSLVQAYEEATFTWNLWARQGVSVPDFKSIHRVRFSESPDPQVVPENTPYPEGTTSDARENYRVEKYGSIFTVTWEMVVNDDLDAISRIPAMHGNACRRKQNKLVYSILTANANMADGNSLFDNSNHSNDASSGTVISVANLNTAYAAMRTQTGIGGEIIGVVPRFLIVPAAIEATAMQVVNSTANPDNAAASTEDASRANFNSGTYNVYGPGGPRPLFVIGEPQLDGNSATAWYLASDSAQIDTVELSFLQGEESPVLESDWDFKRDVYCYKVRQTMGAKALDWRGLYRNTGA